jgi:hypothetical protein
MDESRRSHSRTELWFSRRLTMRLELDPRWTQSLVRTSTLSYWEDGGGILCQRLCASSVTLWAKTSLLQRLSWISCTSYDTCIQRWRTSLFAPGQKGAFYPEFFKHRLLWIDIF